MAERHDPVSNQFQVDPHELMGQNVIFSRTLRLLYSVGLSRLKCGIGWPGMGMVKLHSVAFCIMSYYLGVFGEAPLGRDRHLILDKSDLLVSHWLTKSSVFYSGPHFLTSPAAR